MGDNQLGSSRVDLAELLLTQGGEPAKALQLVDEARKIAKGAIARRVDPLRQATRAWALALLERNQEAGEAIGHALRPDKETHAALFAATRHNVARALLAMGEKSKAADQLRAASEADPQGKCGAGARQQLRELTA